MTAGIEADDDMNQGPQGDRGSQGPQGDDGRAGIAGPQGNQGNMGNQGNPGIGLTGRTGATGATGLRGLRGAPLSRIQALVLFSLVVLIGFVMTFIVTEHGRDIQAQQAVIQRNEAAIIKANVDRCYTGVEFVKRMNAQYQLLADIETDLINDPEATDLAKRIGAERIKAYGSLKYTLPSEPICPPK